MYWLCNVLLCLLSLSLRTCEGWGTILVPQGCHNKVPQIGTFTAVYFFTLLVARSLRPRLWHVWLLLRSLSLTCGWHLLTCSHGLPVCICIPATSLCVHVSSSYRDASQVGLGPTQWPRFKVIASLKVLSPNPVISKVLGVRASTYELEVTQLSLYQAPAFSVTRVCPASSPMSGPWKVALSIGLWLDDCTKEALVWPCSVLSFIHTSLKAGIQPCPTREADFSELFCAMHRLLLLTLLGVFSLTPSSEWVMGCTFHGSGRDVLVIQSCPTLCNPMDCSPPGSSVHDTDLEQTLFPQTYMGVIFPWEWSSSAVIKNLHWWRALSELQLDPGKGPLKLTQPPWADLRQKLWVQVLSNRLTYFITSKHFTSAWILFCSQPLFSWQPWEHFSWNLRS